MDSLRGIESFIRAVELGSIAAAARALEISPAAASQNIARLEKQLGLRLLTRTTRSLALTDSGGLYYQRVNGIVQQLDTAKQEVTALHGEVQGRLCIASTAAFARHVLAPLLPEFSRLFPRINVELVATDRSVDHIKEGVDISVRIKQQLEDGLVAKHIAKVPSLFCASPNYIQRSGCPTTPEALQQHQCLVFRLPVNGRILPWAFVRDGVRFEANVNVAMVSDDIDVLARLAIAGGGITRLAAFVAEPYIASGQLQQLFKPNKAANVQAEIEPLDFYLCVHDRHAKTPKVQAFMDYLQGVLPEHWQ